MEKLINAERLKWKIKNLQVSLAGVRFGKTVLIHYMNMFLDAILQAIDDEPEVDPVRYGRNLRADYPSLFECSECFWSCWDTMCGDTETWNWCPNCGANVEGKHGRH